MSAGPPDRTAQALLGAGVVTLGTRRLLDGLVTDGARWSRVNHRGEPVSLLEGPAAAAGLLAGAVTAGGRAGLAGAVAVTGAATFGLIDDLTEEPTASRKGLRGHLGALAKGELTTGGLKVLGIGATSVVAAALALGGSRAHDHSLGRRLADVLTGGALIAASANLVNLLDLRPGRALKGAGIAALPLVAVPAARPLAAACVGSVAGALGPDLAERDMLGDSGANAMGALVGTAVVVAAPRPVRLAVLAGVVGLTLASERISFTAVIERTPALRAIDRSGRRPPGGAQ